MGLIRRAAVAGAFYPSQADELSRTIGNFLIDCRQEIKLPRPPKAIIVPHAGYVYSGAVAASAYTLLRPLHAEISRVVLLGPVHRVPIKGLALPGGEAFATPLGGVPLDVNACKQLEALAQVSVNAAAHALEHSLEVQLPFLQRVLPQARVTPLLTCDAPPAEVGAVLAALWGGPETLVVISTDLSHYHPYAVAQKLDRDTAAQVLALDETALTPERACGAAGLQGLLWLARQKGLRPVQLDLRSSGDTAGDKARVVGYGAFAFY